MFNDPSDIGGYLLVYTSCFFNQLFRAPVLQVAVSRSQMLLYFSVLIFGIAPGMRSDALIAVIDFNIGGGIKDFYLLADIAVRYTVVVLIYPHTDIAIFQDRYHDLLPELIPISG